VIRPSDRGTRSGGSRGAPPPAFVGFPGPLRTLTGLLLAVALLAACADSGAGDGEAAGGSTPTTAPQTPTTAPTAPTTPPGPPSTTAPGSPGKSEITATGTLRDGVEPGCVLLQSEQGSVYLLVGGDRGKLTAGGRVQVTGLLSPDLLSICQEGQPLLVRSIKPVP
jgi:hypothetical protein